MNTAPSPYFTIDQPADLARGSLDGVPVAVSFGPGRLDEAERALHALRPGQPKHCGEYWAGWYQRWDERPDADDARQQVHDVERMLADGWSINLYMLHGGTNFGFYNGANATADGSAYRPVTTTYDYRASIDEAGRPTRKYFSFRNLAKPRSFRPLPQTPRTIDIPPFPLDQYAPLGDLLCAPVCCHQPRSMESWGQAFGYALYRTTLAEGGDGTLEVTDARDYAVVILDVGRYWNVGPQRRSFVPAPWLRKGRNDIVAFDLKPPARAELRGCAQSRDDAP